MRQFFNFLLAGTAFCTMTLSARAADLKLEARLIWGTDADVATVKYEPLDPALAGKLHHRFKWKNYFDITHKTADIALDRSANIKMSDTCTIRVKNLGGSQVEVNCIGHGKQIHKGAYTLQPPEWLVLGGNSRSNTAWFIGLRAIGPKR